MSIQRALSARGLTTFEDSAEKQADHAVDATVSTIVIQVREPVRPYPLGEEERPLRVRKPFRTIVFSVASTAARFSEKYTYLRRIGYPRGLARRKARWHLR